MFARALCLLLWAALFGAPWAAAQAGSLRLCDQGNDWSAEQKDRLFRFGATIRAELENSGQRIALISRSGLNLQRFGVRYSHAGLSLKASPETPWAIRQLYFACEERRPRLFDQGLSAFLLGISDPSVSYISVVFLPAEAAASLERAALDNYRALQLLGADYSANAYPFSLRYQNCNQWIAELMGATWGGLPDGAGLRAGAQHWLVQQGYEPSVIDVGSRLLMVLGAFIPWVHSDDHPAADTERQLYRVTMPAALENFARTQAPGSSRIEFCLNTHQVVVRRGWEPIAEGCVAAGQDRVVELN